MSVSSFPRREHADLLLKEIQQWMEKRGLGGEVAEQSPDQYRCEYRYSVKLDGRESVAVALHFQLADRLQSGGEKTTLLRILDGMINKVTGGKKSN